MHQYATEALRRVLMAFDAAGIEALPVKGVVLAHTLYDDVRQRPIADVDLRVVPRDLRRVERVAGREGWPIFRNSKQLGSRGMNVCRALVEIETTIGPPGLCAVGVEEMMKRSRKTTGGLGFEHREPELHDHALVLCVNAFKDKLVLGVPSARGDLERIARQPGFYAGVVAERARDAKLRTVVWIVADWLCEEGRGGAWDEVRTALGGRPPRARYVAWYRALRDRSPTAPALSLLARVGSDSRSAQGVALALGAAGTAALWASGRLGLLPVSE